jgi:hypothetical protein
MIKDHPKWHINQILSTFDLEYPEDIKIKSLKNLEKRKVLRKEAGKYILDKTNRLNIKNPLNKEDEDNNYYKIPFIHEKEIIVMQAHNENNHCGRIAIVNFLHQAKWYWYGMNQDIQNIIKTCTICNQPNKYKSLKKKIK